MSLNTEVLEITLKIFYKVHMREQYVQVLLCFLYAGHGATGKPSCIIDIKTSIVFFLLCRNCILLWPVSACCVVVLP